MVKRMVLVIHFYSKKVLGVSDMDYFKVYLQEVGWGVDVPEIF